MLLLVLLLLLDLGATSPAIKIDGKITFSKQILKTEFNTSVKLTIFCLIFLVEIWESVQPLKFSSLLLNLFFLKSDFVALLRKKNIRSRSLTILWFKCWFLAFKLGCAILSVLTNDFMYLGKSIVSITLENDLFETF